MENLVVEKKFARRLIRMLVTIVDQGAAWKVVHTRADLEGLGLIVLGLLADAILLVLIVASVIKTQDQE